MKQKGKWNYVTFWMLVNNSWICAGDAKEFNANKSNATDLEKRTSYWNDSKYLYTNIEKIPLLKEKSNVQKRTSRKSNHTRSSKNKRNQRK
tara:strand:- start:2057 stop:2329 length:273 start_codon:yes stop_codon:yes gene_type:complete